MRRYLFGAGALLLAATPVQAAPEAACKGGWTAAWASAQLSPDEANALPEGALANATLRQTLRPSIAGERLRVRVSNVFGRAPLKIGAVSIARATATGAATIDPKTLHAVTFGGAAGVTVPAGADYLSDPVAMPVAALTPIAVSIHFVDAPDGQTAHGGSRTTSYLAAGERTAAADLPGAKSFEHWYNLSGIEAETCRPAQAIVALGDSITDGHGVTDNGDDRWTDVLAARLQADSARRGLAVVNQGIGGNRLLKDGLGPNVLARLDRDVLAQPGVRYLLVLEGINDIGTLTRDKPAAPVEHRALVARMIGAYQQIVARARAHGIKVIGMTVMPFMGTAFYHPDAANEADRQAVNAWIRAPGHFDAVVDMDRVMRDPARPDSLRQAYDKGDRLHPSPAGYRAMGEAIPLSLFAPPR